MAKRRLSRREVLTGAMAVPTFLAYQSTEAKLTRLDLQSFIKAPSSIVQAGSTGGIQDVKLTREWHGPACRSVLTHEGREAVRIKEVVLFDLSHELPPATRLYGEGFQMLSQTGGTLGQPVDFGSYTDAKHYKMPIPTDARACYGMMTLSSHGRDQQLLAFTSCRRFSGQFRLRNSSLQVVIDTEGLEFAPGETWELEEFIFRSGPDRNLLLSELARRLSQNHPPLPWKTPPTGWCSWYCFGPRVTAQQVIDNLEFIALNAPGLKYVQIDDGYQPAMGDWLETGAAFGGNVRGVLKQIRERGFEPAIWVAPFIAEQNSRVFRDHPDWFMKDGEGNPLRADHVTFGGWRRGPWYALDGTVPAAQKHLEDLFRTMNREWGCTYFKLDANFWGAMHGGRLHDAKATRIEAYRRGMQAILRGAGASFILGCNHPIWPSLGLMHGSRSSNDIKRSWDRVASTARENLSRNWQNGRLWWNDPDAVVLTGDLGKDEVQFHATTIMASGGMVLSGDDLTKMPPHALAILRSLLTPGGKAAEFEDEFLRIGAIQLGKGRMVFLFNWGDTPQTVDMLTKAAEVSDFWSGESLGRRDGGFTIKDMPPRSARLFLFKELR